MATTTFVNGQTLTDEDWFNDVDRLVYDILGDVADMAALKTLLHAAPGAIGGGTPAAGAFTTLTASGNTTLSGDLIMANTKQILALDGDASLPGIANVGDTNTGILFPAADTVAISTGGTERLKVSGGFLRISNTGIYGATSTHEVSSDQDSVPLLVARHTGAAPLGLNMAFTGASPDNNTAYFFAGLDSTTTRIIVYSDGDVVNHDNTYGAISDIKFKQDIIDSGSQWDDIKNFKFRKWRNKSDVAKGMDKLLLGLIADEAKLVSPGLVKEDMNGDQYIVYSVLYMKAVVALQEAMLRIEALEKSQVKK